jgi:hypothetical protein
MVVSWFAKCLCTVACLSQLASAGRRIRRQRARRATPADALHAAASANRRLGCVAQRGHAVFDAGHVRTCAVRRALSAGWSGIGGLLAHSVCRASTASTWPAERIGHQTANSVTTWATTKVSSNTQPEITQSIFQPI